MQNIYSINQFFKKIKFLLPSGYNKDRIERSDSLEDRYNRIVLYLILT
jgi:hypothetical protein